MADYSLVDTRNQVSTVGRWRHRIDVGHGVVTPGVEDHHSELTRLKIPSSLTGQRVLDIGCSDGFYAFTAEERGASEVVAIDDESSTLADANGFRVAAALRGSRARYEARNVERLDPARDGRFDLVMFINVLYHLPNPHLSLQRIASITAPGGLLVLKTYYQRDVRLWIKGRCVQFDLDRRPKWWYFPSTELGGDPTNWWAPNTSGLEALLGATGWADVTRVASLGDRIYYHARRA